MAVEAARSCDAVDSSRISLRGVGLRLRLQALSRQSAPYSPMSRFSAITAGQPRSSTPIRTMRFHGFCAHIETKSTSCSGRSLISTASILRHGQKRRHSLRSASWMISVHPEQSMRRIIIMPEKRIFVSGAITSMTAAVLTR